MGLVVATTPVWAADSQASDEAVNALIKEHNAQVNEEYGTVAGQSYVDSIQRRVEAENALKKEMEQSRQNELIDDAFKRQNDIVDGLR